MNASEQATINKYDLLIEGRLSKAETNCENLAETCREIKQDLRWLIGIGITSIVMPIILKVFHWG